MPVDRDLKQAYKTLYDDHDALGALKLCDDILKENPGNLMGTIYKASCLEKLYYRSSDWHNDQTLENAKHLLSDALNVARGRGDRSKIGLVYFRLFVHYFNNKQYEEADEYMKNCKEYDYKDDTLPMWELQLDKKLKKLAKKSPKETRAERIEKPQKETVTQLVNEEKTPINEPKFRTDWYQSATEVVISLFTAHLPRSGNDVNIEVSPNDPKRLEVVYQIPETGSEFQYTVILAHEVNSKEIQVKVFTKKIEITLKKLENKQWKTLELQDSFVDSVSTSAPNTAEASNTLNYPSSSRKQIDWSKIDLDDGAEEAASADAFFQNLYADADSDTKRAMMKSFIESNGTALNTNWEDVSKKKVETSPPEGMEVKSWQ